MRAPRKLRHFFGSGFSLKREILRSVRPTATRVIGLLFFIAVNTSLCKAGSGSANSIPQGGGVQPHEALLLQVAPLALVALGFAWLKLLTDFYQYRGLLLALLWSWYSWVFIVFIGALSFTFDFLLWTYWVHRIDPPWFGHLSLALGHTGASAAFAYGIPLIVARIPLHTAAEPHASGDRRTTEMNAVFAAIRESLNRRAYGKLTEWSGKYSWEMIKFAAHTLTIDQMNSKIISHDEANQLKLEVENYKSSGGFWDDRQQKYELLRRMMTRSSFNDLRVRLRQASKQQPGTDLRDERPPSAGARPA